MAPVLLYSYKVYALYIRLVGDLALTPSAGYHYFGGKKKQTSLEPEASNQSQFSSFLVLSRLLYFWHCHYISCLRLIHNAGIKKYLLRLLVFYNLHLPKYTVVLKLKHFLFLQNGNIMLNMVISQIILKWA
jgi:hypothetical protein